MTTTTPMTKSEKALLDLRSAIAWRLADGAAGMLRLANWLDRDVPSVEGLLNDGTIRGLREALAVLAPRPH
jgi:hypothetical protein